MVEVKVLTKVSCSLHISLFLPPADQSTVLFIQQFVSSYVPSICNLYVSTDSGLKINTSCTATTDSVCEPLEGFYCTDRTRNNCAAAKKHTQCKPGQFIKQRGAFSNSDFKIEVFSAVKKEHRAGYFSHPVNCEAFGWYVANCSFHASHMTSVLWMIKRSVRITARSFR